MQDKINRDPHKTATPLALLLSPPLAAPATSAVGPPPPPLLAPATSAGGVHTCSNLLRRYPFGQLKYLQYLLLVSCAEFKPSIEIHKVTQDPKLKKNKNQRNPNPARNSVPLTVLRKIIEHCASEKLLAKIVVKDGAFGWTHQRSGL